MTQFHATLNGEPDSKVSFLSGSHHHKLTISRKKWEELGEPRTVVITVNELTGQDNES